MSRRLFYRVGEIPTKPPKMLLKGYAELNTLWCDFGPSGMYKTFRAIDISACVATGKDYHGVEVADPGPVIYVAGEGHAGIRRRFRAWEIHHGESLEDAPIFVSYRPVPLGDPKALSLAIAEVKELTKDLGDPRLIVVDTLSRNFGPGDENSSSDMPRFVKALDQLRTQYEATVLVLHHTGHGTTDRSRGHSAFKAALDWEYRVHRDEDGTLRVTCTKSKDTEPPEAMAFQLQQVPLDMVDEDGIPLNSAVLRRVEHEAPKEVKRRSGKWKDLALTELYKLQEARKDTLQAEGIDHNGTVPIPLDSWKHACKEAGIDRRRFSEAKSALLKDNAISIQSGYVSTSSPDSSPASGSVRPVPLKGETGQDGHSSGDVSGQIGHKPDTKSDTIRTPKLDGRDLADRIHAAQLREVEAYSEEEPDPREFIEDAEIGNEGDEDAEYPLV